MVKNARSDNKNKGKSKWSIVYCKQGKVIVHVCYRSLVSSLTRDLRERFAVSLELKSTKETGMELGGIMWIHRGYQDISIDGLKISIPYDDFADIYDMFNACKLRTFKNTGKKKKTSDVEYYKLHSGYIRCLVVTPAQRDTLLDEMKRLLPFCEQAAENEFVEQIKRLKKAKTNENSEDPITTDAHSGICT